MRESNCEITLGRSMSPSHTLRGAISRATSLRSWSPSFNISMSSGRSYRIPIRSGQSFGRLDRALLQGWCLMDVGPPDGTRACSSQCRSWRPSSDARLVLASIFDMSAYQVESFTCLPRLLGGRQLFAFAQAECQWGRGSQGGSLRPSA